MEKYISGAFKNKELIMASENCGCYYCKTLFKNTEIEFMEEKDGGFTGVCPHCGIDSIVDEASVLADGKKLNGDFLDELHSIAF